MNGLGDYAVVNGKLSTITAETLEKAYLCNLDVTKDGFGATFEITGISVGPESVDVSVSLKRTGAVVADGKAAPINGRNS